MCSQSLCVKVQHERILDKSVDVVANGSQLLGAHAMDPVDGFPAVGLHPVLRGLEPDLPAAEFDFRLQHRSPQAAAPGTLPAKSVAGLPASCEHHRAGIQ